VKLYKGGVTLFQVCARGGSPFCGLPSTSLSSSQAAEWFRDLGAYQAMELDGGGSSTTWCVATQD
jgi:hypothetical protein